MRVLLCHLDGKLPNLALMRIAAHHRALVDDVELRRTPTIASVEPHLGDRFDRVYASLIFETTRPVAERLLEVRPDAIVGGTGWNLRSRVEDHGILTKNLDYSDYPRWRSSIGFTQRGCRLRCSFCVVPSKEGDIIEENTIAEIWRGDPYPREVILLDNDFFGQPRWQDRIEELRTGRFKVCFSQGINARMLTSESAAAIASVNFRNDSMKTKRIYTAWDNRKDARRLFDGLNRLVAAGVKPDQIMVYMLIGYWAGETSADREYRRAELRAFGARPYPMPYHRTPELVGFQRWVIGAYDKRVSWKAWCAAKFQPANLGSAGTQTLLPLEPSGPRHLPILIEPPLEQLP